MWRLLSLIQKNLVWMIPISMLLGLVVGYLVDVSALKYLIIPVTFVMVYPMMATLNVKTIFKGRDIKLQTVTQLINFLLIPALAFFVGKIFLSGAEEKFGLWAVGLFLIGVLPTSGMTISWTGFARGNKEAAIKMVVFGLVLGALAAPIYTKLFMGASVEVNMLYMFRQIVIFVFVPLAAGLATQFISIRRYGQRFWDQRLKPKFPPFSALGVVLIAFVAMSLKARGIIANPRDIIYILVPLILFYLASYVLLSVLGRLMFNRNDAVAMVFGVVMRDLSVALAIAMTAFGKEGLTIALLISLAYVIQIQSAAWFVRFVDVIFGKPAEEMPLPAADAKAVELVPERPPFEKMVADIKRILFATDLSDTARHAVRYACSLGHRYDAQVTILHVIPDVLDQYTAQAGIDIGARTDAGSRELINREEKEKAAKIIKARIAKTSLQVLKEIPQCPLNEDDVVVKVGVAENEIVETAHQGNYDLIIMGTQGHGKIADIVIGSTTDAVIRKTSVPVLLVKLPAA